MPHLLAFIFFKGLLKKGSRFGLQNVKPFKFSSPSGPFLLKLLVTVKIMCKKKVP